MVQLVAVYHDREAADAVAMELREEGGVPEDALRVADAEDVQVSIAAEMDAEAESGWGSGLFGFMTSEMARGALVFGALGAFVGALLGTPVGVLLYDHDIAVLTRVGIGALVGALFGWISGTLLGGGMAVKSPEVGLAAERGVPLVVEGTPDELAIDGLEALMAHHDPIRIDRIVDGQRVATVMTEEPSGVRQTVDDFVANTREPARR